MSLPKRIRVVKCSNTAFWHRDQTGREFECLEEYKNEYKVSTPDLCQSGQAYIDKTDCEPIYDEPEVKHSQLTRSQVLETAMQCVTKDRNATHGEPEDNFGTIAAYWNNYIESRNKARGVPGTYTLELNAADVAAMMVCVKLARIATSQNNADHWVDGAGYFACGGEIATKRAVELEEGK